MTVDLALQVAGDYPDLLETARFCEANGLVALALPDHYLVSRDEPHLPAYDALTQLAGLARETTNLELSTLVSPVTFRHPAVLLKSAVTIDLMSGGRFTLGMGAGWFEGEHRMFGIPFPDRRFDLLEESLKYVRAGLDGREFRGDRFEIIGTQHRPRPSTVKVVVGGGGPARTPSLAGRFADEFNVYMSPMDQMKARIDAARRAAEEAGRGAESLLISSTVPIVTGTNRERFQEALSVASRRLGRTPREVEETFSKRGIPVGPSARVDLGALEDIGVTRLYVRLFDTDPTRRNDTLAALTA